MFTLLSFKCKLCSRRSIGTNRVCGPRFRGVRIDLNCGLIPVLSDAAFVLQNFFVPNAIRCLLHTGQNFRSIGSTNISINDIRNALFLNGFCAGMDLTNKYILHQNTKKKIRKKKKSNHYEERKVAFKHSVTAMSRRDLPDHSLIHAGLRLREIINNKVQR